ncbi:MAG: restriction endonuclease subunit S [Maribacter arcticus]|uniref:restriction endonuclease subunit S n=1 Tax=Maribacter arcticus TaxID=561365 RepID=UPI003001B1BD
MSAVTTHIKTDKQLIPALRFKGFEEDWNKRKLKSFENKDRKVLKAGPFGSAIKKEDYVPKGYKVYGQEQVIKGDPYFGSYFVDEKKFNQLKTCNVIPGDLLISLVGTFGKVLLIPENAQKGIINPRLLRISISNNEVLSNYLKCFFLTSIAIKALIARSQGGTMGVLNSEIVGSIQVPYPSLPEQQKIASFLSAVDEKIQQLTKKKALLEQYKKGVMQQLFSGQLRFKDENGNDFGDWRKLQLSDIAERVKTKNKIDNQNVLTISAQLGLVSQLEYFNKSVSAKNLRGYYLLERNDFAYNKSYSNGYPMGAIKRLNKYDLGVVSTLYICFKFNKKVSLDFMEQYFERGLQNKEIEKVAQEGARNHGLLNIGINDFFDIDLKIPSFEEQEKIAAYLSRIDTKIESVIHQITQTQTFKKGLLQQMFVAA